MFPFNNFNPKNQKDANTTTSKKPDIIKTSYGQEAE